MRNRMWSAAEIEHLARFYATEGAEKVATDLGRSKNSVSGQARRLGLSATSRLRRQAVTQAKNNRSVDVHFFDQKGPEISQVLAFIRKHGTIRTKPRYVIRLRCRPEQEETLLAVRSLLQSRHRVQHRCGRLILELCSRWLVERILARAAEKSTLGPVQV